MRSSSISHMRFRSRPPRGTSVPGPCVLFLGALDAAGPTVARADDSFMSHPVDSVSQGARPQDRSRRRRPTSSRQSRPKTEGDFVPVGEPHPTRPIKVKTPAELKAAEAELDAARIRHDKISGSKASRAKAAKKPEAKAAKARGTGDPKLTVPRTRFGLILCSAPPRGFFHGSLRTMTEFHRVKRLPPYVFEQVNRLKASARAAGADIIDLGMGNPDLPAPKHVIDKLVETAGKPRTDRYSASKGIAGLRRAQANYYARRFGVKLDPEQQVVATLGSKEGFANMAQAITAPGDVVLVPNPSYPIHAFGFLMAGGVIRSVPAEPTPDFFVALERAVIHSIPKPIAVVVCYPSNPTAMVASLDFYRDLVAFAKKHEIFVLSDLAYAEVYFDDNPPPSMLQVPGAIDVTVEFTSMSKTYSMPGWRMGFAVGNERLLSALTRVKSYLDYGAFTPIQVAAAAALNGPGRLHRRDARHLQGAPRRHGRKFRAGRLADPGAGRLHVRLGADPAAVPPAGQPRILQAADRKGRCRGRARHRLRRARRRLRPSGPGRERAAHPPGGARHPALLRYGRQHASQRRAAEDSRPELVPAPRRQRRSRCALRARWRRCGRGIDG